MKGKLIKTDVNYILEDDKGVVIASTSLKKEGLSLSLKNCQAIERGYDLDELAKIEYPICEVWNDEEALIRELAFKKGFKKALELLGDKKFSEEDLRLAMDFGKFGEANNQTTTIGFIQSLQQTEWDVEIEIHIVPEEWENKPRLDSEGCLILKRI
jgi:hypothetical protein